VSVYVDDMRADFGRMKMCHMIADTEAELLAMVDKIGVARRWRQGMPGYDDHFDIALSKRALAVAAGAVEITWRQLGMMIACRKRGLGLQTPATAQAVYMEHRRAIPA
jgi:Protein of unknown function (DUF4031)